ncbi:MAG: dihydropteroate synthase [Clostridia bacterium]|nr:dihydropteroate synthase [Clostridia bacterium]
MGREPDFAWGRKTYVMGVLNVTPDSFSDGGRYLDPDRAVAHALRMVEEGADLIDVGGESTAPGREPVPAPEELRRVVPVVERLAALLPPSIPISVDTYKAEVARAAVAAGATVVNDVTGLRRDPEMAAAIAELGATAILVHSGEPRAGEDPAEFVASGLARLVEEAEAAGIRRDRIWVDPGFGFGKGAQVNLALTRHLSALLRLGRPIVYGASRKRTVGLVSGLGPEERDAPSLAFAAVAALRGADVVRTHEVRTTVRFLRALDAIARGFPEPFADVVHIAGMAFRGRHGAYRWEREREQPFVVDVTLFGDWRKAAVPDDLGRAVDYTAVHREAERVVGEVVARGPHRDLLETLADRIARALLRRFDVERAWVRVHKPEAAFPGPVHDVAVEVVRGREDLRALVP